MDSDLEYQKALDTLYSYVDFSLTRQLEYSPEKFNLDRMTRLLDLLGNPQKAYRVVHIAGTKGKGSVSALCASVLRRSGLRTGLYTSPHLIDYCERIQVDGEPVSHTRLVKLLADMKQSIDLVDGITTFEITTALAFQYFKEQGVEYAVVEVGLGGRLDATNVVDPQVTVVTSISYDHQAVLGHTLAEIAGEKAGIVKQGKPVVIAPQQSEALEVLLKVASERNAEVRLVGEDILSAPVSHNLEHQSFMLWKAAEQAQMDRYIESGDAGGWNPVELEIPLLGAHQVDNAATAYSTLMLLQGTDNRITADAIREGFRNVAWPGRFEVISRKPVIVLDSAHNRESALKLRLALEDYLPGKRVVLLFGASEDKDVRGMLVDLMPRVDRVVATRTVHPRAMEPDKIVELVHRMGRKAVATASVEEGFENAVSMAGGDMVVLVAGSIFLAAAVKELWIKHNQ